MRLLLELESSIVQLTGRQKKFSWLVMKDLSAGEHATPKA